MKNYLCNKVKWLIKLFSLLSYILAPLLSRPIQTSDYSGHLYSPYHTALLHAFSPRTHEHVPFLGLHGPQGNI